MDRNVEIITDNKEKKLVRINDIRFKGKRSVDWDDVKGYLEEYVGQFFQIASSEDGIVERYNVFHASLLIRHDNNGKMYLYDVIDIKKKRATLWSHRLYLAKTHFSLR